MRTLNITPQPKRLNLEQIRDVIVQSLDADKAEDILVIDIARKSSVADYLVIASGSSARHVGALAMKLNQKLQDCGLRKGHIEGMPQNDWVLVDTGDIIVHLLRPETRAYYDIEGMWGVEVPNSAQTRSSMIGALA